MPRKIKEKSENDTKPKREKKVKSSFLKDKVIIKYEPTELVVEWPKNLYLVDGNTIPYNLLIVYILTSSRDVLLYNLI